MRRYQHQISPTNERPEVSSSQFTDPKQSEPLATNRFNRGKPKTTRRTVAQVFGVWFLVLDAVQPADFQVHIKTLRGPRRIDPSASKSMEDKFIANCRARSLITPTHGEYRLRPSIESSDSQLTHDRSVGLICISASSTGARITIVASLDYLLHKIWG